MRRFSALFACSVALLGLFKEQVLLMAAPMALDAWGLGPLRLLLICSHSLEVVLMHEHSITLMYSVKILHVTLDLVEISAVFLHVFTQQQFSNLGIIKRILLLGQLDELLDLLLSVTLLIKFLFKFSFFRLLFLH
jgi:hypothetical protein